MIVIIGARYVTRSGRVTDPVKHNPSSTAWPFLCTLAADTNNWFTVNHEGFVLNNSREQPEDLVKVYRDPTAQITLRVGRSYLDAEGELRGPVERKLSGRAYPMCIRRDGDVYTFTEQGKYVEGGVSPRDLLYPVLADDLTQACEVVEPDDAEPEPESWTCDSCSAKIDAEDIRHTTFDDDDICENCLDEYHAHDRHGHLYHLDDLVWVETEDEYYHQDDPYLVYSNIEEVYLDSRRSSTAPNGETVSEDYFNENYFICDSCNETRDLDEYYQDCVCNSCSTRSIKDYNDDVHAYCPMIPLGRHDRPYRMGVELEIENLRDMADEVAEDVQEELGGAILKHDGSLDHGFEVVTVAAPYSWHVNKMWTEERLSGWRDNGGRSFNTSTCGLHVHVGRDTLTTLQIAKTLVFVNNPQNLWFIELIAQRSIGRWAARKDMKYDKRCTQRGEKYEAVNVNKRATIEFRIFKGTLAREGILRALQFVQTLLAHQECYGKESVSVDRAHKLIPYLEHVCRHAKRNAELASWLAKKSVLIGDSTVGYTVSAEFVRERAMGIEYTPIKASESAKAAQRSSTEPDTYLPISA